MNVALSHVGCIISRFGAARSDARLGGNQP
jgi:hypothetical protein